MGKKRKGEKLDGILLELQKLRGEVKTLAKQQAELAVQIDKLSPRKPVQPARKPPAKATKPKPAPARKAGSAPKRPVLVPPPVAADKAAAQ